MAARRQPRGDVDEVFWALVASIELDGRSGRLGRGRFGGALVVLAVGAAVAVSLGVGRALFQLHPAFGLAWLYLGAPVLVFASLATGARARRPTHRR